MVTSRAEAVPMDANSNCGCRKNRHHPPPYQTKHYFYPMLLMPSKDRQDVSTVDIRGAFLHTKSEREVIIRLDQQMAMQLARINNKFAKDMVEEKGQKVIYGKANKALYGKLNASLLFWKDLTGTIDKRKFGDNNDGFILNPYDTCVANYMINGKQYTIIWHVDDLKISHEDPVVVTDIIWLLNNKYGKSTPMVLTCRKVLHEYLGHPN